MCVARYINFSLSLFSILFSIDRSFFGRSLWNHTSALKVWWLDTFHIHLFRVLFVLWHAHHIDSPSLFTVLQKHDSCDAPPNWIFLLFFFLLFLSRKNQSVIKDDCISQKYSIFVFLSCHCCCDSVAILNNILFIGLNTPLSLVFLKPRIRLYVASGAVPKCFRRPAALRLTYAQWWIRRVSGHLHIHSKCQANHSKCDAPRQPFQVSSTLLNSAWCILHWISWESKRIHVNMLSCIQYVLINL